MGDTTPLGLPYPDGNDHTRTWEHWQALAEAVDALIAGTPLVQSGDASIPFAGTNTEFVAVTFPIAFGGDDGDVTVVASAANAGINVTTHSITTTGYLQYGRRLEGAAQNAPVTVRWVAIGPRP